MEGLVTRVVAMMKFRSVGGERELYRDGVYGKA